MAFAKIDAELRDFLAKGRPRKRGVEADDVALWAVRYPSEDVLPSAVRQRQADECTACVVDSARAKAERFEIAQQVGVDYRVAEVVPSPSRKEEIVGARRLLHVTAPTAQFPLGQDFG